MSWYCCSEICWLLCLLNYDWNCATSKTLALLLTKVKSICTIITLHLISTFLASTITSILPWIWWHLFFNYCTVWSWSLSNHLDFAYYSFVTWTFSFFPCVSNRYVLILWCDRSYFPSFAWLRPWTDWEVWRNSVSWVS